MAESESSEVSGHLLTVLFDIYYHFQKKRPDSGAREQFTRVPAARALALKRSASCTSCHTATWQLIYVNKFACMYCFFIQNTGKSGTASNQLSKTRNEPAARRVWNACHFRQVLVLVCSDQDKRSRHMMSQNRLFVFKEIGFLASAAVLRVLTWRSPRCCSNLVGNPEAPGAEFHGEKKEGNVSAHWQHHLPLEVFLWDPEDMQRIAEDNFPSRL